jgi:putative ABC transport system substrate-binding protein
MTTAESVISSHQASIVDFAAQHRLISMYGDRIYPEAGGLMFFGTSTADMWRHAAVYADRIFKGAKPGELPVEQPTRFELLINRKTAKALGLTIPPSRWRGRIRSSPDRPVRQRI